MEYTEDNFIYIVSVIDNIWNAASVELFFNYEEAKQHILDMLEAQKYIEGKDNFTVRTYDMEKEEYISYCAAPFIFEKIIFAIETETSNGNILKRIIIKKQIK